MRRLHPATVIVAFIPKLAEAIRALIPIFAVSFLGGHGTSGNRTEILVALMGILGGFGAIGAYVTTRFDVVDGQIVHRSGWIFRRDRRIPLSQVQNVNLRQGILERLLKVVTLEVETAAGKGSELKLSVLTEREAERFRNELMAESAHPDEVDRDDDVYRISPHDLWLGAVTEHHFVAFVFAALPLIGMGKILALTHFWSGLPLIPRIIAGVVLGLLGLIAGWAFGAVQYVLRYGGFTVRREPGATRVSYGLTTKIQVVIRPARIEYAILTSTPWQRLVGRQGLAVGTAGTFGEQGTIAKLALMMPNEQVRDAVGTILPGLDVTQLPWQPFPKIYFRIILIRGLVATLISAAIAYPFVQLDMPMRWFMLVLPFYVFADFADRLAGIRRAGVALGDDFIAVRQGFFRQKIEIMPLARAEVLMSSQPPWWRRSRLVALHLKAMVHLLAIPVLTTGEAESLRDRLEEHAKRRHTDANADGPGTPFGVPDFHDSWALSRGRFVAELEGLNQEQLNWRLYPGCLTIGEAAIHVAGIETKFAAAIDGLTLDEIQVKVQNSATDGVVNDKPFPFSAEELTPEFVSAVLEKSRSIVEPILLDPNPTRRGVSLVSALGPVISGEGAMARWGFHAGYHQGQVYLVKNAPGFPA